MRELRLIGVHDDGEHLLLTEDGDDRFTVPIDDALRASLRRAAPAPSADIDVVPVPEELRPRDVQALLRAGVSVTDVAERAGWTVDKVRRYEGPIRAERDHVAGLARQLAVSGGSAGRADTTFGDRVEHRLDGRGVEADDVVWDSWRGRDGDWTVLVSFPAGGRQRRATWHFDVRSRTLEPTDDEARWLGEDEGSPGPLSVGVGRESSVYDVEAEGGLNAGTKTSVRRVRGGRTSATAVPQQPAGGAAATTGATAGSAPAGRPKGGGSKGGGSTGGAQQAEPGDGPVDLVAAMRERSKKRRRKGRSAAPHDFPEDAAPREHLDTSGEAPPVGSHPRPEDLAAAEGAAGTEDTSAPAAAKPSVEQLGHDPVTGTADLFADLDEPAESQQQATDVAAEDEHAADEHAAHEHAADDGSEPAETAPGTDTDDAESRPVDTDPVDTAPVDEPQDAEPDSVIPDRPTTARKGRPSVPSWDDIMFGRRPGRD